MTEQQQAQAAAAQDKYDQMMRLADLFDSSGDEMRERATLGAEILADEGLLESEELSKATFAQAEQDIIGATTGKTGSWSAPSSSTPMP